MHNTFYTLGIAVTANEKESLKGTVSTLERDLESNPLNKPFETIICLNNSDTEMENITRGIKLYYPSLKIRIISSEPGLINAQKKILESSNEDSDFIIFYDADVRIHTGTTNNIAKFMDSHPLTKAASGNQIALNIDDFLYGVYNIFGINSNLMTPRKYLTGRDFAVRKKSYFVPDFMTTEDTFLSRYLVYTYGREAIKSVPNACVTYIGPRTLRDYFNKIRRLDLERKEMFAHFPEFKSLESYFRKSRLPKEIVKLSNKEKSQLYIHDLLVKACKIAADLPKTPVWVPLYSTKEDALFDASNNRNGN